MKRPLQYLVIATLFMSTFFPVLAQTNDGKIPFQGVLYEAGEPVTATKQMIFSIAVVSWTETHSVSVVNGLYSVVLGEITPFPENLFETSNTASLGINVAGSALPPVEIHAPYLSKALVKKNMPDQIELGTEGDYFSRVNGGLMEFKSTIGTSIMNYWATGSQHTNKVASQITLSSDESTNIELSSKNWMPNGINLPYIALKGDTKQDDGWGEYTVERIWMEVNQDTNTSREWGNMNLSSNDGANTTLNADGINFNGPNGESFGIDYNGLGTTNESRSRSFILENDNGQVIADLINQGETGQLNIGGIVPEGQYAGQKGGGVSMGGKFFEGNPQHGYFHLRGPVNDVNYFDANLKFTLEAVDDGNGNQNSDFQMYSPELDQNNKARPVLTMRSKSDDQQHWASEIQGFGSSTLNFALGAKTWETDKDGSELPYLQMKGSYTEDDLVWMEVFQDTNTTTESGNINFRGTDGSEFGINSHGFTGSVSGIDYSTDGYTSAASGGSMNFKSTTGTSLMTYWATGSQHTNKVASQITLSSDESTNIELSSKNWIPNGINLPYVALKGNTKQDDGWGEYTVERIWMEVNEDTNSNSEWGQINLTSKDGNSVLMDGQGRVHASHNIDVGGSTFDGELTLNAMTGTSGIRMYSDFNSIDQQGSRAHLAVDGTNGNYVYMWGDGSVDASVSMSVGVSNQIYLDGSNGNINISGTLFEASDKRLKKDIKSIDNSLDNVKKLRGVSYTWKDKKKSQANQIGLIAQEVEKIYPEFVHTDKDGMKSVNYAQMTAVLIEAVKELSAKVTNLEDENSDLKASMEKLSRLESKINLLEKLLISKPVDASTTTAQK